jgi:hypothetical protein
MLVYVSIGIFLFGVLTELDKDLNLLDFLWVVLVWPLAAPPKLVEKWKEHNDSK